MKIIQIIKKVNSNFIGQKKEGALKIQIYASVSLFSEAVLQAVSLDILKRFYLYIKII